MAKRMNYEDLALNLPDAFRKDEDSNNYKILKVNRNTFDEINDAFKVMFDALNINSATGQALDDIYGGRVNLPRGSLNDDQYRIRLKGKMMKDIVDGSFDTITEALAYILLCDTEDIQLQENGDGTVSILNIPLSILIDAGFEYTEILSIVEEMLPVTVTVNDYSFTGTFEFSGSTDDYDENAGFADDEQTIGGYLGLYGTGGTSV